MLRVHCEFPGLPRVPVSSLVFPVFLWVLWFSGVLVFSGVPELAVLNGSMENSKM